MKASDTIAQLSRSEAVALAERLGIPVAELIERYVDKYRTHGRLVIERVTTLAETLAPAPPKKAAVVSPFSKPRRV